MEVLILVLAFVVMVVGLVGVLVPVLPGLVLVWLAATGSVLWQGTDAIGWAVAAWFTLLFGVGTLATVVLPAQRGRERGVSSASLSAVVLGAIVGMLVLPVLGLPVGALAGLYLGEWHRLGDRVQAGASARAVLAAYGVGVLIELVLGTILVASWLLAVVTRAV
ncbi:MAG: DUF456 domain-containing protein [Nitriliruptoraceae bacterium]